MAVHCELRRSEKEAPTSSFKYGESLVNAVVDGHVALRVANKYRSWSGVLTDNWTLWRQANTIRFLRCLQFSGYDLRYDLRGVQSLKQEVHSLATAIGVALGSCRRLTRGYGTHHMHGMHGESDGHEVQ